MGSRLRALQVLETRRQTTDRAAQNGLETSVPPHALIRRHPHRLRIKPAMLRVQQLRRRALCRPLLPRRRRRGEAAQVWRRLCPAVPRWWQAVLLQEDLPERERRREGDPELWLDRRREG